MHDRMKLCNNISAKKFRHAFDFPQNKLDTPIFDTDSFAVHRGEVEGSSTYKGHTKELALVKVTHLPRFGKNRGKQITSHGSFPSNCMKALADYSKKTALCHSTHFTGLF